MNGIKKRALSLILTILVLAAAISGATLAWFSDWASTDETVFTAGTLLIEANTLSFYAIEYEGNGLYEVFVDGAKDEVQLNKIFSSRFNRELNGLAYDRKHHRLYYTHLNGNRTSLYYYDLAANKGDIFVAELSYNGAAQTVWGAAFGMGSYWYINNATDDLYKINFEADGTYKGIELYHQNFTGKSAAFGFGDIAMEISQGKIYASTSTNPAYGASEYFVYDITDRSYQKVQGSDALNLQLALGSDGNFYGHVTREMHWYKVNRETGKQAFFFTGERMLSDLASNYQDNWNPGDSDMVKWYVTNTGTKSVYLKAGISGVWSQGLGDENIDVLLNNQSGDWVLRNGAFYYKRALAPGEKAFLSVYANLSGPDTQNAYQGETYRLTPVFEAIQTTNGASGDKWGLVFSNGDWTPVAGD